MIPKGRNRVIFFFFLFFFKRVLVASPDLTANLGSSVHNFFQGDQKKRPENCHSIFKKIINYTFSYVHQSVD